MNTADKKDMDTFFQAMRKALSHFDEDDQSVIRIALDCGASYIFVIESIKSLALHKIYDNAGTEWFTILGICNYYREAA